MTPSASTVRTALLFFLLSAFARADFSWDAFPQSVDILSRLVSAAEHSKTDYLTPHIDPNDGRPMAYYVRSASYIGECRAAFGAVHLLAIHYTRSAPKDSRNPPRGHSFVLFFDHTFTLRSSWRVDFDTSHLSLRDGSKVFFGDTMSFDYTDLPKPFQAPDENEAGSHVVIDGQSFIIPTWSAPK